MTRRLQNQFTAYATISNNRGRQNNFYFFLIFFIKKVSDIIDQIMGFLKDQYKFLVNLQLFQNQFTFYATISNNRERQNNFYKKVDYLINLSFHFSCY